MESRKTKSTSFPRDALEQAQIAKTGWEKVGKKLTVPNLSVDKFESKLNEAQHYVEKAQLLKVQRAKAIEERNVFLSELWDLTKRVRNAAKATFGDYSPELETLLNAQKSE
ncbi:hypothetical protein IH799_00645 [candidate division KSB1 bacterium]|nr:hypothetical protein [candidate division KSB1 bacterium]